MNVKTALLLAISASLCTNVAAQIPAVDVQGVCAKRISGYVAGLETALVADASNSEAKAELDRISNLSPALEPCDKLQQIPDLVESDRALQHASDSIKVIEK